MCDPQHLTTYRPPRPVRCIALLFGHFCQRRGEPQGLVLLEGLGKLKKFNDIIGIQTPYLQACSVAPLPSTLRRFRTNGRFNSGRQGRVWVRRVRDRRQWHYRLSQSARNPDRQLDSVGQLPVLTCQQFAPDSCGSFR
jgi:hypothetical protein